MPYAQKLGQEKRERENIAGRQSVKLTFHDWGATPKIHDSSSSQQCFPNALPRIVNKESARQFRYNI